MPRTKGAPKTSRVIKRDIKITDTGTKGRKKVTDITIEPGEKPNVATTSTVKVKSGGRPSTTFVKSVTKDMNTIE